MTWNTTFGLPPVSAPNDIVMAYPWIDLLQNVFFTLSCVMSISLLVIICSYLHNMRSVNECVLLQLYKDFVDILIISRISLVMKGIVTTFTITDSQNVATMNQLTAKVMSFSLVSLTNLVLLMLNIIGAIRLYMTKTKMLDPPMPWGNDDDCGIKIIRLIVGVISVGYPLVLFPFEIFPKVYYDFVNRSHPKSALLHSVPCIVQVVVFLTTMLVENVSGKKNCNKQAQTYPNKSTIFSLPLHYRMAISYSNYPYNYYIRTQDGL